jgi:hypothetical protein
VRGHSRVQLREQTERTDRLASFARAFTSVATIGMLVVGSASADLGEQVFNNNCGEQLTGALVLGLAVDGRASCPLERGSAVQPSVYYVKAVCVSI